MTVGIYIRVSTEDQAREGFSIDAQKESLISYCRSQGWDNYVFYIEPGYSAKDTNRPRLNQLFEDIERGKIDTVLVYRLDRLTRSVLDLYEMLAFFEKHNCTFKSATEVYDTGSAMGRLFITLVAALAQWERENTGERVRMGQIEKARQGEYSAPAPFGFRKKNGRLVVHEKEKEVILDMIKKVEEGYSMRRLAEYMNESPHRPKRSHRWHGGTVLAILKNPALYGAIKWLDEITENTHEGIITKEEFEHLSELLRQRQNFKKRNVNSFFVYQMKLICPDCGNHLTSERYTYTRKTDGVLKEHNRYRCQSCANNKRKAVSTSEKKIEEAFLRYIEGIRINGVPKEDNRPDPRDIIDKKIERILNQREKYQKAWANNWMTDKEFEERMLETKDAIQKLEDERAALPPREYKVDPEQIKKYATDIAKNYKKLTAEEKHEFLNIAVRDIHFSYTDHYTPGKNGKMKKSREINVTKVEFL